MLVADQEEEKKVFQETPRGVMTSKFGKWCKGPESAYSIKAIEEANKLAQRKKTQLKFFQSERERDAFILNRYEETKLNKTLDYFEFSQEITKKTFQQEAQLVRNRSGKLNKMRSISTPSLLAQTRQSEAEGGSSGLAGTSAGSRANSRRSTQRPKSVPMSGGRSKGDAKNQETKAVPKQRGRRFSKPHEMVNVNSFKENARKMASLRKCSIVNFERFVAEVDLTGYIEEDKPKRRRKKVVVDGEVKEQTTEYGKHHVTPSPPRERKSPAFGSPFQGNPRVELVDAASPGHSVRKLSVTSYLHDEDKTIKMTSPLEPLLEVADDVMSENGDGGTQHLPVITIPIATNVYSNDDQSESTSPPPAHHRLLRRHTIQNGAEDPIINGVNEAQTPRRSARSERRKSPGIFSFSENFRAASRLKNELKRFAQRRRDAESKPEQLLDRVQQLMQEKQHFLEQQMKVNNFIEKVKVMTLKPAEPMVIEEQVDLDDEQTIPE